MKIAILTHSYPPDFGAAPFQFRYIATRLQAAGHRVEVFTAMPYYPKGSIDPAYRGKCRVTELRDGITVHRHWLLASHNDNKWARLAWMLSLSLSFFSSLPQLWRMRPDVLLVQTPPMLTPLPAVVFKKLLGCRLLLNVSDLWPLAIADLGLLRPSSKVYRLLDGLQEFFYRRSDAFMVQSEETLRYLRPRAGHRPLLLSRTGVECDLFLPKRDYVQRQPRFRLVYTGVLGVAHGLLQLCQQVDFAAQGAELHLYGQGFEYGPIADWIARHPGRGVVLHDPLPLEEVAALLPAFDAVLICQKSRVRGTVPAKLYEAMAAAVPMLFHGDGEGSELVARHGCGYCSLPSQPQMLVHNLRLLQQASPQERALLGAHGRQAALQVFSRQAQTQPLLDYLSEM